MHFFYPSSLVCFRNGLQPEATLQNNEILYLGAFILEKEECSGFVCILLGNVVALNKIIAAILRGSAERACLTLQTDLFTFHWDL